MYDRTHATKRIVEFLESDSQSLVLVGTHQQEKHSLVLSCVLAEYPSPANILLRVNHSSHYRSFLNPVVQPTNKLRPGAPIPATNGHQVFVDTMNRRTWESSPAKIDVAILYPIDSYGLAGIRSVEDVMERGTKKLFLVTWTDNKDVSWAKTFQPEIVRFDAESEYPDIHREVQRLTTPPPLTGL